MNNGALATAKKNYTVDEYLTLERNGQEKHEFYNGRVEASTGSNRRHNLIASNITIAIGSRLRRHKCELYVNNMHVKLSDKDFCYPDVTIVKDKPAFLSKDSDILLNPTVIIEILSEKTLIRDKTHKLEKYMALESVCEYLLVREEEMRVEHYAKQNAKQWMYRIYDASDEMISMESIMCKVTLSELYSQIKY